MQAWAMTVATACALALAAPSPARASEASTAAAEIHRACVARGEEPVVCACGVGLAYGRLDPKIFLLMPRIEPLLDERDPGRAIAGVAQVVQSSGLTLQDGMAAYETIRANRRVMREICGPVAAR